MTIGERIKLRREELGLSVAQLADKLNKDRTTIYRYESSYIENMPINILEPLALALQTTPAYLMGWTIDLTAVQYGLIDEIDKLDGNYSIPLDNYNNPLADFENPIEFLVRQKLIEHIPTFHAPSKDKDYFKATELGKTALQSQKAFKSDNPLTKENIPIVLQKYNCLSREGKNKVLQYLDDLLSSGKYSQGNEDDNICATVDKGKKSLA